MYLNTDGKNWRSCSGEIITDSYEDTVPAWFATWAKENGAQLSINKTGHRSFSANILSNSFDYHCFITDSVRCTFPSNLITKK